LPEDRGFGFQPVIQRAKWPGREGRKSGCNVGKTGVFVKLLNDCSFGFKSIRHSGNSAFALANALLSGIQSVLLRKRKTRFRITAHFQACMPEKARFPE
jgi:hypothetical protein